MGTVLPIPTPLQSVPFGHPIGCVVGHCVLGFASVIVCAVVVIEFVIEHALGLPYAKMSSAMIWSIVRAALVLMISVTCAR